MNGDLSLSQSLGGLRIANPDDEAGSPSPPPSHQQREAISPIAAPPSSHSSSSTVTQRRREPSTSSQSQPDAVAPSLGSIGFDPQAFSPSQSAVTSPSEPPPRVPDQRQQPPGFYQPQSIPLTYQQQQSQNQYPPSISPTNPQARPSHNQISSPTSRPVSGIYNHPNLSSSSGISSSGSYRYRDDSFSQRPSGSDIRRSNSKAAAAVFQAGVPTRERSIQERQYRQPQTVIEGNGPLPPRKSSRRTPMGNGSPPGVGQADGTPYGVEGGPMPSSEEWKERGAAVGVKKEVDANGQPINRVVKKGVKDFNFGRTLGEGSYSTVLAATDRQTLREYAIKVLDKRHIIKEKKVKYVNIEKDTLNRLTDHPGVVRLYYTFQDERSLYFVLDLASGGELLGFLKKMGTFDIECTRFYTAQILDAVGYMHSRGVIHRDLKPENVLLDDQMHVKITDFGTAKILDVRKNANGGAGGPLDGAGSDRAVSFVGTAEYVSPELLTDKNACKASDLWAFGCIVYQLLAGRPPFKAGNEYQTFQKIVGLEYSFPEGFPDVARDLVERLLVLDPGKRLPIEHIKNHEFFDGVTWGKALWKQKAPRLKAYVPPDREPIRLNGGGSAMPPPNIAMQSGSKTAPAGSSAAAAAGQLRPTPRVITELPPPSQLDIEWSPVLTRNNERILKLGNMMVTSQPAPHSPTSKAAEVETPKKFSRFFGGGGGGSKKRLRLVMVTSSARIIICADGGNEKKSKLEVSLLSSGTSWRSFVDSRGLTAWCVDTRDKHFIFEDPKATTSDPDGSKYSTQEWLDSVERARDIALSQSLANSFSGNSAFNDLSSTISSPSSTLGGNADDALEGVNIPTTRHLRKERDDTDSIKGRKRFSKRHSKNGLAAVF